MTLVVGLAGQIACGKSTVAAVLKRQGAAVISGDELGREVVTAGSPTLKKLVRAFGPQIVGKNGNLRREQLGRLVFADPRKTKLLNDIVHPELLRRLRSQIKALERSGRAELIVIDAALIFDWKLERELDLVIVVDSPRAQQLARLAAKGVDRSAALARIRRQLAKNVLWRKADIVLDNNGSRAELTFKARKLHEYLGRLHAAKSS